MHTFFTVAFHGILCLNSILDTTYTILLLDTLLINKYFHIIIGNRKKDKALDKIFLIFSKYRTRSAGGFKNL